ncbi:MAG: PIN domain-containing protein [Patescibacteria group bacterium]
MIDSSVFISIFYERDEHHELAKKLFQEFVIERHEVFITEYAFNEIINFLTRKKHHEYAEKIIPYILENNKIKIIYNTPETFLQTANEYKNYSNLSFTDVNIVIQMRRHGLKELLSFDSGFDEVNEIKRIH